MAVNSARFRISISFYVIVVVLFSQYCCAYVQRTGGSICFPLRILPLGDSITKGSLSSSGDGYRGPLQSLLLGLDGRPGADVDFVGKFRTGNMTDNDHQGVSGTYLSEINESAKEVVGVNPNLVLLHAGTNDMDKNREVSTAIDRLEAIIRTVAGGSPGAAILVAELIVSRDAVVQQRTDVFNTETAALVARLKADPDRMNIMVVNMSHALTAADLKDRKHPSDRGYELMAQTWNDAITTANAAGMIKPPEAATKTVDVGLQLDGASVQAARTCGNDAGTSGTTDAPQSTQSGSGSATLKISTGHLAVWALFLASVWP